MSLEFGVPLPLQGGALTLGGILHLSFNFCEVIIKIAFCPKNLIISGTKGDEKEKR